MKTETKIFLGLLAGVFLFVGWKVFSKPTVMAISGIASKPPTNDFNNPNIITNTDGSITTKNKISGKTSLHPLMSQAEANVIVNEISALAKQEPKLAEDRKWQTGGDNTLIMNESRDWSNRHSDWLGKIGNLRSKLGYSFYLPTGKKMDEQNIRNQLLYEVNGDFRAV